MMVFLSIRSYFYEVLLRNGAKVRLKGNGRNRIGQEKRFYRRNIAQGRSIVQFWYLWPAKS